MTIYWSWSRVTDSGVKADAFRSWVMLCLSWLKSGSPIFSENWMVTFCSFFEKKVVFTVIGVTDASLIHVYVSSSYLEPLRQIQADSTSM